VTSLAYSSPYLIPACQASNQSVILLSLKNVPDNGFSAGVRDESFMRLAIVEALKARDEGDVPVGAVLVDAGGEVLAQTRNRREAASDPTAHAEVLALREAAGKTGGWRLEGATLYVTKEPCIMCAGAMINARIARVVFGCADTKAGAVVSLYQLLSDNRLNHRVRVDHGVLEDENRRMLQEFFRAKRLLTKVVDEGSANGLAHRQPGRFK